MCAYGYGLWVSVYAVREPSYKVRTAKISMHIFCMGYSQLRDLWLTAGRIFSHNGMWLSPVFWLQSNCTPLTTPAEESMDGSFGHSCLDGRKHGMISYLHIVWDSLRHTLSVWVVWRSTHQLVPVMCLTCAFSVPCHRWKGYVIKMIHRMSKSKQ